MPTEVGIHNFSPAVRREVVDADLRRHDGKSRSTSSIVWGAGITPRARRRGARKNGTDERCTELPGALRPAAPSSVDAAADRLVDLIRQLGPPAAREYWEHPRLARKRVTPKLVHPASTRPWINPGAIMRIRSIACFLVVALGNEKHPRLTPRRSKWSISLRIDKDHIADGQGCPRRLIGRFTPQASVRLTLVAVNFGSLGHAYQLVVGPLRLSKSWPGPQGNSSPRTN